MNTILICFLLSWWFTNFEPIQNYIENLTTNLLQKYTKNNFIFNSIDNIYTVLSCFKCFSLWFTLIVTLNPLYAILTAFLADTYLTLINKNN